MKNAGQIEKIQLGSINAPRICKEHGLFESKVISIYGNRIESSCPKCDEENGLIRESGLNAEIERIKTEQRDRQIQDLINYSKIPTRNLEKGFKCYKVENDLQKIRFDKCLNYAKNLQENLQKGKCLALVGTTGTGKTHLACAIGLYLIRFYQKRPYFITLAELLRQVKETYSKKSEKTESEVLSSLVKPDLLLIDEVESRFGSESEKSIFFEIFNKRYEALKPTILISNLSPRDFENFIGQRIFGRLIENEGEVIYFNEQSKRK